jgi:hypothetical protein
MNLWCITRLSTYYSCFTSQELLPYASPEVSHVNRFFRGEQLLTGLAFQSKGILRKAVITALCSCDKRGGTITLKYKKWGLDWVVSVVYLRQLRVL